MLLNQQLQRGAARPDGMRSAAGRAFALNRQSASPTLAARTGLIARAVAGGSVPTPAETPGRPDDPAAAAGMPAASPLAAPPDAGDGRPRVAILGGGFGGLYTAVKLELLMWPRGRKPKITLVDQGDRFVFKPLLYELLNGTADAAEVAPPFSQLLAPYTIQFVQDKVAAVQPAQPLTDGGSTGGGSIAFASGAVLPYDYLVVSLGAAADPRGVPGVRQHARPFVSLQDAEFVAGRLARAVPTVVVVGAGYAGAELASVIGERAKGQLRVLLLTPGQEILQAAPPGQREAATQALQALGVSIVTGTKVVALEQLPAASQPEQGQQEPAVASAPAAAVVEMALAEDEALAAAAGAPSSNGASGGSSSSGAAEDARYLVRTEAAQPGPAGSSDSGSSSSSGGGSGDITADLVLWTAGSRAVSQPLQPFPADARGQLQTEPTLQVAGHSRVFALGDVSRHHAGADGTASGSSYPATAQVAFQQADYAAWNVWAAINGRPLLPFRYQHLGDMMSLGAANAAVALPLQLPPELARSLSASPLGSLLSLAGVRLDRQQGITLGGPLAQLLRRGAYLYRQPTNEQRLNVAVSWLSAGLDAAQRQLAEAAASSSSSSSRGSRSSSGRA